MARTINAPRDVALAGMPGNEGWHDTLWASWEPARFRVIRRPHHRLEHAPPILRRSLGLADPA